MVHVCVGNENVRNGLSSESSLQCLNVFINHWAWVNDRNVAVTDDVGSGAVKSEARGVSGGYASDEGRHRLDRRVFELILIDIRNRHTHAASLRLKKGE